MGLNHRRKGFLAECLKEWRWRSRQGGLRERLLQKLFVNCVCRVFETSGLSRLAPAWCSVV